MTSITCSIGLAFKIYRPTQNTAPKNKKSLGLDETLQCLELYSLAYVYGPIIYGRNCLVLRTTKELRRPYDRLAKILTVFVGLCVGYWLTCVGLADE